MTIGQVAEVVVMVLVPMAVARLGRQEDDDARRAGLGPAVRPLVDRPALVADDRHDRPARLRFGFFFVVAQMYVDRAAEPDIKASAQNLLIFLIYGLGTIVGSVLTG